MILEPCPFCDGEAEITRLGDHRVSTIYTCTMCGCTLETGEEFNHGRVWNQRAQPDGAGRWKVLLQQCLRAADLGVYRDATQLRIQMHPAFENAREALAASSPNATPGTLREKLADIIYIAARPIFHDERSEPTPHDYLCAVDEVLEFLKTADNNR